MILQLAETISPDDIGYFKSPDQVLAFERVTRLKEEITEITATVMSVDRYEGDGATGGVDRNNKKRGDVLLIDAWVPEGGNRVFRGQVKCIPVRTSMMDGGVCEYYEESDDTDWDEYRLVQMGIGVTKDRGTFQENTSFYFYNEKHDNGTTIEKYTKKDLDRHTWQEATIDRSTGEIRYLEYSHFYEMDVQHA